MNVSGQISNVEFAVEKVLRETVADTVAVAFKADAEDDARAMKEVVAAMTRLAESERQKGELQRELADTRVERTQLLHENEQLREDLESERQRNYLTFVEPASELAA